MKSQPVIVIVYVSEYEPGEFVTDHDESLMVWETDEREVYVADWYAAREVDSDDD